ncbi:hypothetical protein DL767_002777 [Monosporascus sp. MG133]|nr:hypothetical protein DL767_002777 [Monosporascus sp. MG133]
MVEKRLVPNCLSTAYSYVALSYVWGKSNSGVTTKNNLERRIRRGGLEAEFDTLPAVVRDACSIVDKLADGANSILDFVVNPTHCRQSLEASLLRNPPVDTPGASIDCQTDVFTSATGKLTSSAIATCTRKPMTGLVRLCKMGAHCLFSLLPLLENPSLNLSYCSFALANTWHIRHLHLRNQTTVIQWNQNSLITYDQLVADLPGRKLTVADDILKAFAGLVAYMESNQAGPVVAGTPLNILDRELLWAPTQELRQRVLQPGARRIPSWSWCAWDGQVRYTWATFGVLSRLMNCDVMSISSCVSDIFLEDKGSLRRVDRLAFDPRDPSRKLPQGTAAGYSIYPLGCHPDGGQYLHFKTVAAPAAVFSIDAGQITLSEAGGDWGFFLSTDPKQMIRSFTRDPFGVFATMVEHIPQADQLPISTIIYQQRNKKEPLSERDGAHPACWISDKHDKRCGILLDYEKPTREFFLRRDCWFILLSVHAKLRGKCVPAIAEARGDRFMLHGQYLNARGVLGELALYNVPLVREDGGYMTRVGLAQIEEEAFVKAAGKPKCVVLG